MTQQLVFPGFEGLETRFVDALSQDPDEGWERKLLGLQQPATIEVTAYPTLTVLGNKVLEPRREVEKFPNPHPDRGMTITCRTDEFTCACPVTGQPDFASVEIVYIPRDWIVESKSLKLYLWSFRDEKAFHENLAGIILKDLEAALNPIFMRVILKFMPRGGIAIEASVETGVPEFDE